MRYSLVYICLFVFISVSFSQDRVISGHTFREINNEWYQVENYTNFPTNENLWISVSPTVH